ncbi:MAG TPA: sigma 54-interacting transcriptional regulator, partial [Pyrinomonadaceae bacterium]|nr:sigma 54-interacting transcriptional regulator [Pyrinomonadaceae bacterium]
MNELFLKSNLIILAEIGQRLADSNGLRDSLGGTLAKIHESDLFVRSFTALYEPQNEKLSLYAAFGFNANEYRRLETRLNKSFLRGSETNGENRVLVRKTSPEAAFDFIASRQIETSFLGVPIVLGKRKAGFLGVEIVYDPNNDFDCLFSFLAVIASMISQALKSQTEIATEKEKLFEETSHLQHELRERYDFNNLVGNSGPMRQIYAQVTQVARSNATVLLRGESGTGKEMIANALHYNSLRAKKPIIKINCAALPETLIEAELFGYEKGAFTGANQRKKGRFELADGGTLFLDEIGDLPLQTQVKLLRVLQEREFERLGGTETLKVNVRLITATNKNLEAEIAAGNFREDLFYRLNVFTIFLPPLRER